jgi:cell division protein FtsA
LGVTQLAGEHLVASLDIGTSKAAVIIAEMDSFGVQRTIGIGTGFHNGLHRGTVSDADAVVKAVVEAVIKAERMAQVTMPPAVVGIPGSLCSSFAASGTVTISRSNHRVQSEDVERVLGAAEAVAIPPGRRVIHRFVRAFRLDGRHLEGQPLGLIGRRLEVDATLPVEMKELPEVGQNPAYIAAVGLVRHRTMPLLALSEAHESVPAFWAVLWQKVRDWLKF